MGVLNATGEKGGTITKWREGCDVKLSELQYYSSYGH